jgi:hypothetical protein
MMIKPFSQRWCLALGLLIVFWVRPLLAQFYSLGLGAQIGAIGFNQSADLGSNINTAAEPFAPRYTLGANSKILVLYVEAVGCRQTPTASYDGIAMTLPTNAYHPAGGGSSTTAMFYLINPPTGTNSFSITCANSGNWYSALASDYTSTQTPVFDSAASATDPKTENTFASTFTVPHAGDWVIVGANNNGSQNPCTAPTAAAPLVLRTYAGEAASGSNWYCENVLADSNGPEPAGSITSSITVTNVAPILHQSQIALFFSRGANPISIRFTPSRAPVADNATNGMQFATFVVDMDDGSTYLGIPTIIACAKYTPSTCPFGIAGSTGAWKIQTRVNPPIAGNTTDSITVQAGSVTATLSIVVAPPSTCPNLVGQPKRNGITISPTTPTISHTAAAGTVVATVRVAMSDHSRFCGNLNFPGRPATASVDGTDNGNFTMIGNQVVVAPSGPTLTLRPNDPPRNGDASCMFADQPGMVIQNIEIDCGTNWYAIEVNADNVTIQNVLIHGTAPVRGIGCYKQNHTGLRISHVTFIFDVPESGPAAYTNDFWSSAIALSDGWRPATGTGGCLGAQVDHVRCWGWQQCIMFADHSTASFVQMENQHASCQNVGPGDCTTPGSGNLPTSVEFQLVGNGETLQDWSINQDLATNAGVDLWNVAQGNANGAANLVTRGRSKGPAGGLGIAGLIEGCRPSPCSLPSNPVTNAPLTVSYVDISDFTNGTGWYTGASNSTFDHMRARRIIPSSLYDLPWYRGNSSAGQYAYWGCVGPSDTPLAITNSVYAILPGDYSPTAGPFSNSNNQGGFCTMSQVSVTEVSNYTDRDFIQLRGTGMPGDGGAGHLTIGSHRFCIYADQNGKTVTQCFNVTVR